MLHVLFGPSIRVVHVSTSHYFVLFASLISGTNENVKENDTISSWNHGYNYRCILPSTFINDRTLSYTFDIQDMKKNSF